MQDGAVERGEADLRLAIAAFYDTAVTDVYRYLHRATAGDRRLAEDLAQETFMACVDAARRGTPDALTMPWLMGVARHKMIDHFRQSAREQRKLSLVWKSSDDSATPAFDITDGEALSALGQLSSGHRLVLVLRYLDDLPVAEVANAIGRSRGATESLLIRARQALDRAVSAATDSGRVVGGGGGDV